MKGRLASRLVYLWTFELPGAAFFVFLVLASWKRAELGPIAGSGLALVVFLLCQGSLYWLTKLYSLRRRPLLSDGAMVRLFQVCRALSIIGILAMSIGLIFGAAGNAAEGDYWVGFGLLVMAGLEYVNYYHFQLMYDSPTEVRWLLRAGRLKPAVLGRDLKAGRFSQLGRTKRSTQVAGRPPF